MELQELSPIAIMGQIWYPLSARYPDVRGSVIEEVTAALELPNWGWGDEFLNFFNDDRTLTLIAGGRESRVQMRRLEDVEAVVETFIKFFEIVLSRFNVTEVDFIGARSFWIGPVDSFEELRDNLLERLGSTTFAEVLAEIPGSPSDSGWVVEFHSKDPKHALRVGPMTREQVVAQFIPDAPSDDFPPQFLFLDLDRFLNDGAHPASDVPKVWEHAFARTWKRQPPLAES